MKRKRKAKYAGWGANCLGYAIKQPSWMTVPDYNVLYDDLLEEEVIDELINIVSDRFRLKPVKKEDMVLGKEYVAFRWDDKDREYGDVGDYHFIRRHKTGHWTHKPGAKPVVGVSQKYVFSDAWDTSWSYYNSDVYLFELLG